MRPNILVSLLLCLSGVATPAIAQENLGSAPACIEEIVRDTASSVRKGIDAGYGHIADAIRRKDIVALFALHTADFWAEPPNGEVWTRERALAYQRDGLLQVRQTQHISNTIIGLKACGNHGTATLLQVWDRTQMMRGKLRRVDTHAVQDEQWFETPAGWQRGKISHVINGVALVDGQRVDTNKPYDPEAPAYDPYDPHPRRSGADTLLRIATERGRASALESARELRRSAEYYVSEAQLNALGYRLLAAKRLREAIDVFELNTALYPRSPNVYDSLGEAYMANGDRDRAIRSYRHVLRLDPRNVNAAAMLRQPGAGAR